VAKPTHYSPDSLLWTEPSGQGNRSLSNANWTQLVPGSDDHVTLVRIWADRDFWFANEPSTPAGTDGYVQVPADTPMWFYVSPGSDPWARRSGNNATRVSLEYWHLT